MRILPLFVFAMAATGISAVPPNSNCEWATDARGLHKNRAIKDLRYQAEIAEDLAIRYADARRGPHSGNFAGRLLSPRRGGVRIWSQRRG